MIKFIWKNKKKSIWKKQSRTIQKYKINVDAEVLMPTGAEFLSVHFQDNSIFLWALVDPNVEYVKRTFMLHGTNERVKNSSKYIGTAFAQNTHSHEYHVFEYVS